MQIGKIIGRALLASLEANLLVLPASLLVFYPFIQQYELQAEWQHWVGSGLFGLGAGLVISWGLLVPATVVLETRKRSMSRQELAGSLGTLSLALLIFATLTYKGFSRPGDQGKTLLFALLMTIMIVTWAYTIRYKNRIRNTEAPAPNTPD